MIAGRVIALLLILSFFVTALGVHPRAALSAPGADGEHSLTLVHGKLPLYFEPNRGQTRGDVSFVSRGREYSVLLAPSSAEIVSGGAALRFQFLNINPRSEMRGVDLAPGRSNYFFGSESTKWRANIPHYAKVEAEGIYPGIDLVYYGTRDHLEYDFVVSPGVSPETIAIQIGGTETVGLDPSGDLVLRTADGEFHMRKPLAYQDLDGGRKIVEANYRLEAPNTVRFVIGTYDRDRTLTIDPVLAYATYLGGSLSEATNGIAVDADGNIYVCGATSSSNFPRANPIQGLFGGVVDAFVSKISADGSTLVYSTYLGGGGYDDCLGLTVDSEGNVYLHGEAGSGSFPVVNSMQPYRGGSDAFLAKLDSDGSALVYSTFLGGTSYDAIFDAAVDSAGAVYLAGLTLSTNFPTVNPIQPLYGGGLRDGFVGKVNPQGSALVYSTYLGRSGEDECRGIAIDSGGNVYVTGDTRSLDFPTMNPIQPIHGGGLVDAFVTKINADGTAFVYSTFLGGSSLDETLGLKLIAVDTFGNAYVTGTTRSPDFPTVNALQPSLGGTYDAFVVGINSAGSALLFSTYLGGNTDDGGFDVALGPDGHVYVSGRTYSRNFPSKEAPQQVSHGQWDAFVSKITGDGSTLVFSTYFGGNQDDRAAALAVDANGDAYITGQTNSADLVMLDPLQPGYGGSFDAYIAKFDTSRSTGEVERLFWTSKTEIEWTPEDEAILYNIYRGNKADLAKLLDASTDSCTRLSTPALSSGPVLTEPPPAGALHWYLVRAQTPSGLGPAGSSSFGWRIHDTSGNCP